jgi:hypothetical protein
MATKAVLAAGAALCAGFAVGHAVSRRARPAPAVLRGGGVFKPVSAPHTAPREVARDVCAFCNMAFQPGDECTVMSSPCAHVFHTRCLETYNKQAGLQPHYVAHCPRCHVATRVSALTTFSPVPPQTKSAATKSRATKSSATKQNSLAHSQAKGTSALSFSVALLGPPSALSGPDVSMGSDDIGPHVHIAPDTTRANTEVSSWTRASSSSAKSSSAKSSSTSSSSDGTRQSATQVQPQVKVPELVKRTTVSLQGGRTCSLCSCASCAEGTDGSCLVCGRCKCKGCVKKGCKCACTCVKTISQFTPAPLA